MNKQFDWKHIKKSDWIVLALIGAILLVIVLPEDNKENAKQQNLSNQNMQSASARSENTRESDTAEYAAYLEEKLEEVLGRIEGVGKVQVMLTLSDKGEAIVEKDTKDLSNSVKETEPNGGSKDTFEREIQSETVRVENENGTYPYVEKMMLPTVEGVLIVAEGGGNAGVAAQISKAVLALFPIDAHKIIVVKMSQGG